MARAEVSPVEASLDDAVLDEVRAQRVDSLSGPDSPEGRELGQAVGRNVARLREERGIDLVALAGRTGIRQPLLEALESGGAVPSLRAIWHLAKGLEVPFGSLLAHTMLSSAGDPDFRVQRLGRGRVIASSTGQFRSRVLYLEGDPRAQEVYELTLAPGCLEEAEPHAADTFEHIVITNGEMVIRAGSSEVRLNAGDSIFFRADVPHGYANPGSEPTRAILVMSYARGA
jgi:quercetin dioxygenase-like cupin family protein